MNFSPERPCQSSTVLITVGRLDGFTGSEVVTRELAEHFASRGYRVIVVTNLVGASVQEELRDHGDVSVLLQADPDLNRRLDAERIELAWIQHLIIPNVVFELDSTVPVVFNHMSRVVAIETPLIPELEARLATVAVFNSPRVKDWLTHEGLLDQFEPSRVQLFANPAPDAFASSTRSPSSGKPRLAVVSNHIPAEVIDALKRVEHVFHIELIGVERELGAFPRRVDPRLLSEHDLVITIGKTAQYAIAAGVAVYCYDHLGGPGWLSSENFEEAKYGNFAGRTFSKKSAEDIASELEGHWQQAVRETPWIRRAFGPDLLLSTRMDELLEFARANPLERGSVSEPLKHAHRGLQAVAGKWFQAMSSAANYRANADELREEVRKVRDSRDRAVEEVRKLRDSRDRAVEEVRKLRDSRDGAVEEVRKLRDDA